MIGSISSIAETTQILQTSGVTLEYHSGQDFIRNSEGESPEV